MTIPSFHLLCTALIHAIVFILVVACSMNDETQDKGAEPAPVFATFLDTYVSDDGRIIDSINEGISHSEGQGYGLLFAVEANDQAAFGRIAQWTQVNLAVRDDGLLAWRWAPYETVGGRVTDQNNATDGDILVAWAYLRAFDRWNRPADLDVARAIMAAIRSEGLIETPYGLAILPGVDGFQKSDGVILNLSYWIFPALERFAEAEPEGPWRDVYASGLKLLFVAGAGKFDLPPDWIRLDQDGRVKPAQGWPAEFGYNAIRIPIHLCGLSVEDRAKPLERFDAYFNDRGNELSTQWDVTTDKSKGYPAGQGFQTVAELTTTDCQIALPDFTPAIYYEDALSALAQLISGESNADD